MQDPVFERIVLLAKSDPAIEILWLYGSRATGKNTAQSDYDLAVAFIDPNRGDVEARALRPQLLAMDWSERLELDSKKLSLVDINRIPILLAIQIIQLNRVLLCKNGMRLAREENRITGLYETDIRIRRGSMDKNYLTSLKEHMDRTLRGLDELRVRLESNHFGFLERKAAERLFQEGIEACIGLSKQWVRDIQGDVAGETLKSFIALKDINILGAEEYEEWKRIVGFRNILVHEYLDLNPEVLEKALRESRYRAFKSLLDKALSEHDVEPDVRGNE